MKTNWLQLGLMPPSDYWHAIDSGVFADYSGNGRHLTSTLNYPEIIAGVLGNNSAFYFDGTKDPLKIAAPNLLLKHIFMLVKVDAATFTGNEGLLSDTGSNNILAGGGSGTAKFINLSLGFTYYKNNVAYAESNLLAPMNEWALLEIQAPAGLSMVGFQIGQQLGGATAKYKGWFAEDCAFSRVLSADERRAAILYYNLKFGAYLGTQVALEFPDSKLTKIEYARFNELPPDWDEITVDHKYQDGGKSFNETSDAPPRKWEIGFTGLTYDEMRIFDEFDARARRTQTFDFTDKWGEKHSGVRIENYERTHEAHLSRRYEVKFKLVQY